MGTQAPKEQESSLLYAPPTPRPDLTQGHFPRLEGTISLARSLFFFSFLFLQIYKVTYNSKKTGSETEFVSALTH